MPLRTLTQTLILAGIVAVGGPARGQDALDEGWSNPPVQARRRYWWWLNGNVTQEAITKDLKWMTASGVWNGLVIDYLDADALRWYWHAVVDPLIADAGPLVGRTWKMVQTDSWELGGVNWTATFPAEFNKRGATTCVLAGPPLPAPLF